MKNRTMFRILICVLLIYVGSLASNFYYSYRSIEAMDRAEKYIQQAQEAVEQCRELLQRNEQ